MKFTSRLGTIAYLVFGIMLIIFLVGSVIYSQYTSSLFFDTHLSSPLVSSQMQSVSAIPLQSKSSSRDVLPITSTKGVAGNIDIPKGEIVSCPATITGEITGSWYFEGSFPVRVESQKNELLFTTTAVAQTDWQTDTNVSFSFPFDCNLCTDVVNIILIKSNPSGDPIRDDSITLTEAFTGCVSSTAAVKLYFTSKISGNDCTSVTPVMRTISYRGDIGKAVLTALFAGVTEEEAQAGLSTQIPAGVTLNSIREIDNTLVIDVSSELQQIAGSCAVTLARAQIDNTIAQFPIVGINSIEITVNGSSENVLQP